MLIFLEGPEKTMATTVDKTPRSGAEDWRSSALEEVAKLARLPENWDGYGSPPLAEHAVRTTIDLLRAVEGNEVSAPHLCPVTGGGLGILWQAATRRLEIEVVPDGSIEYAALAREEGAEHAVQEGCVAAGRSDEVRHLLKRLIGWLVYG